MIKKYPFLILLYCILFSTKIYGQLNTIIQFGHDQPVTELTYSDDGKILASTDGFDIKLWDISTGMEFKTLNSGEGKIYPITHLHFVNGGNYILSYLFNQKLIYQNALTGDVVDWDDIKPSKKSEISIEEKLNNKYPKRFSDSKEWDDYSEEIQNAIEEQNKKWEEFEQKVSYVSAVHDSSGKFLLTKTIGITNKDDVSKASDLNNRIIKYNKKILKKGASVNQLLSEIYVPNISEYKSVIELFKRGEKEPVAVVNLNKSFSAASIKPQWNLHLSPDTKLALEGKYLFNLKENKNKKDNIIVGKLELPGIEWACSEFSSDGKFVISGSARKNGSYNLFIWDLKNIALVKTTKNPLFDSIPLLTIKDSILCPPVVKIIQTPNPQKFITLHSDQSLRYWDINTGQEDTTFKNKFNLSKSIEKINEINAVVINKSTSSLITGGVSESNPTTAIYVWNISTGSLAKQLGAKIAAGRFSAYNLGLNSLSASEWQPVKKKMGNSFIRISQNTKEIYGVKDINLKSGEAQSRSYIQGMIYSPDLNIGLKLAQDSASIELHHFINNSHDTVELKHSVGCKEFVFSNSSNKLAGIQNDSILIWDAKNGNLDSVLICSSKIRLIAFNQPGNYLAAVCNDSTVTVWNIDTLQKITLGIPKSVKTTSMVKETISRIKEFKDRGIISNEMFDALNENFQAFLKMKPPSIRKIGDIIKNSKDKRQSDFMGYFLSRRHSDEPFYSSCEISDDGKKIFLWRDNGYELYCYDLVNIEKKPEPEIIRGERFFLKQEILRYFYYNQPLNDTSSQTIKLRAMLKLLMELESMSNYSNMNKGTDSSYQYLAVMSRPHARNRVIKITDLQADESKLISEDIVPIEKPYISPTGKYLASSSSNEKFKVIRVWDLKKGTKKDPTLYRTFYGHCGELIFSKNDSLLISSGKDRQIKVWQIEGGKIITSDPILSIVSITGTDDYIIYTPEGYYMTTKGETNTIAFQLNNKAYPFEQFDLKFNRPDIVVKKLSALTGFSDTSIINIYYKAYKRRLEKSSIEPSYAEDTKIANPPSVNIVDKELLPDFWSDEKFPLPIKFQGINKLKKLDVFVNGVSIFGSSGKSIVNESTSETHTIQIPLSDSINRIQVRVTDEKGIHSFYDTYDVKHKSNIPPSTYLVNICLSEYKNEGKNLPNFKKDANDWKALFSSSNPVIIDIYDSQATYENILRLKDTLMTTHLNDKVIIYYSGHGNKTDQGLTTYYAGSNDNHQQKEFLATTDLEKLLDSIPARNKFLIINACYVGEESDTTSRNMRKLFINLERSTGSSIIVSCEKSETSLMPRDENLNSDFGKVLLDVFKSKINITVKELAIGIQGKIKNINQNPYAKFINYYSDFTIK